MKLLCLFSFLFSFNTFLNAESFAFYYGKNFKDKSFYFFDNVVVQVDNIDKKILEEIKKDYLDMYLCVNLMMRILIIQ
jgi:hypothetical protein